MLLIVYCLEVVVIFVLHIKLTDLTINTVHNMRVLQGS